MEYQQIIAATTRQFELEDADIEARQGEVTAAQELLDRRRRALKRKRAGFERMMHSFQDLDAEVATGRPARSEEAGDQPESAGDEAA